MISDSSEAETGENDLSMISYSSGACHTSTLSETGENDLSMISNSSEACLDRSWRGKIVSG